MSSLGTENRGESGNTLYSSLNGGSAAITTTTTEDFDGFEPTQRRADDDIIMALQEENNNNTQTKCCSLLGCCCCCVHTSVTNNIDNTVKYPFIKRARRYWKLYFFCYFLVSIAFFYYSSTILSSTCYNHDIYSGISDYVDFNDSSSNFCNLYYWVYIWVLPYLLLIIAWLTERVTLRNDMRGDRLIFLLNIIGIICIFYLYSFFDYIDQLLTDHICVDYQSSSSYQLKVGCSNYMTAYPMWVFCNTIYLVFTIVCVIHERIISLHLNSYDFRPSVMKYRTLDKYEKSKAKGKKIKTKIVQSSKNAKDASYWNDTLIKPTKQATEHVIVNIFHLDRENMKLGLLYVWSEIKRNNFSFIIGLFTVFISTYVAALLPAINEKTPIIFLKFSEANVGENDMLITASFGGDSYTSHLASNNDTHNITLEYQYNDDWIASFDDLNITGVNITRIINQFNVSALYLTNSSNFTNALMNSTGMTQKQINAFVHWWNDNNNGNINNNNFSRNTGVLNVTDGEPVYWKEKVNDNLFPFNPLLNFTFIDEALRNVEEVSGCAPRWYLLGNVTAGRSQYAVSTIVLGIDSLLEQEIGIGRSWKNIKTLQDNECYLMNSITRAMNITDRHRDNYKAAEGEEFVLFANVAGIQNTFGLDLAAMYLDSNGSVQMEQQLIKSGIARSCITIHIVSNSRPNDFTWKVLDISDLSNVIYEGNVFDNADICLNVSDVQYYFRIDDAFGNGLCCNDVDVNGYYQILWDGEEAYTSASQAFSFGSYDIISFERPAAAYGSSKIEMDNDQKRSLSAFLTIATDEQYEEIVFSSMINGDPNDPQTQRIMEQMLPTENATKMVNDIQNSTYNESVEIVANWLMYYIGFGDTLEISKSVESGDGKWSSLLGSVTVIDAKELSYILFNRSLEAVMSMNDIINAGVALGYIDRLSTLKSIELMEYYAEQLSNVDLYDYAVQIIVMYTDRYDAYMGSIYNLQTQMVWFTDAVFTNIDGQLPIYEHFNSDIQLPIYEQMQFMMFFKLDLNNIMFSCIVLMTSLVLIVIYSLMLNDVDERTYTYGMLRALGMKRITLIQILIVKAVTFSIPAVFFALILVQVLNVVFTKLIEDYASMSLSYGLPSICYVSAFCVGFIAPMISIYIPTSRALSKTLRDSLDVYHHVSSDLTVTMVKLENLGFSPRVMGVAIVLVSYGIICSVLVPTSIYFMSKNVCWNIMDEFVICVGSGYDLFFGIFAGILLAMIFGMCIMFALLAIPISSLIIRIVLSMPRYCSHYVLRDVVLKNLNAHASRNMKTSIMFIICIGFCIFAGCSNTFMVNSCVDFLSWLIGADFMVFSYFENNLLPVDELWQWLDTQKELGIVDDYTSITFPLSYIDNDQFEVDEILLSSLAGEPSFNQWVVGLDKNYLDVMMKRFQDTYEVSTFHGGKYNNESIPYMPNGDDVDVVRFLYRDAGQATLPFERHGIDIPKSVLSGKYYFENYVKYENGGPEPEGWPEGYYFDRNKDTDRKIENQNASYTEYIDIIISKSVVTAMGIDINEALVLQVNVWDADWNMHYFFYLCKIRAVVNKMPGLVMLPFDTQYLTFLAGFQNAVITTDQYAWIMKDIGLRLGLSESEIPDIPYQKIGIKMSADATELDYEDMQEGLRNYVPNQEIEVDNMHQLTSMTRDNVSLVNYFFLWLAVLGLILSFFILWLSFLSNIRSRSWELGVLRAIGCNKFQVTMIYIYEGLAIITSCIILGTTMGTVTAYILCTQFNLFLMMPIDLGFPLDVYLAIIILSVFVAIVGSYLPMRPYIKNCVASVLRAK